MASSPPAPPGPIPTVLLVSFCALRGATLLATQLLVAGGLSLAGDPAPLRHAGDWWTVWGTAADLVCLLALAALLRREGARLLDLYGGGWPRLGDLPAGLGLVLVLAVVGALGGTLAGLAVLGTATPPAPVGHLPPWASVYSTAVWPVLWGFTEEAVYVGYAAPRLRARLGAPAALAVVALFWAGQHLALPFRGELDFAAFRVLSSLPMALVAVPVFWRLGRLWPLAIAHVLLDVATGALTFQAAG